VDFVCGKKQYFIATHFGHDPGVTQMLMTNTNSVCTKLKLDIPILNWSADHRVIKMPTPSINARRTPPA